MKKLQNILILSLLVFVLAACDREPPIPEVGSLRLELASNVGEQEFATGEIYTSPAGRKYRIDFFRFYLSDISLIKEDGSEVLLSEVNLFDIAEGGPAKRVKHGFNAYKVFQDIEPGTYKGIKFGIGIPDRLNVDPANYALDHPLSIGNQMYWSWRAGYKFISIEGFVDSTANMTGAELGQSFVYHTGKDSVDSPNVIYREISFTKPDHGFTLAENEEVHFELSLDIEQIFFNSSDPIDLLTEGFSHSVPGEQFNLSVRVTDNLLDHALTKKPF